MPTLILGVLVLILALWLLNAYSRSDPKVMARLFKGAGGAISLLVAAVLFFRGRMDVAIPLGAFGLGLLGWLPFGSSSFGARTSKSAGQVSRVRTRFLEMELDHDSGAMRGRVLSGRQAGVSLDSLDLAALLALAKEIDGESRSLLVAYLDRREPRWREHADAGATAREGSAPSSGKMTEQEAYQILGIEPGAGKDEIGRAHRTLMKKLHPDQGGSTYLAARVNEAKDVLLRRHR